MVTTVMMPDGHDADELRRVAAERFNLSLGAGLGRLKGRAFRIGHLGDFNELMLVGTLCGVEMALTARGRAVHGAGGVDAAIEQLAQRVRMLARVLTPRKPGGRFFQKRRPPSLKSWLR